MRRTLRFGFGLGVAAAAGLALTVVSSCRPSGAGLESVVKDDSPSADPDFLEALSTAQDYKAVARTAGTEDFVKFSYFFGVTSPDPVADKIYFQNTKKWEFHQPFLQGHVARYAHITDYDDLILGPEDQTQPSAKEITAGAAYLKGDTVGYGIYFRTVIVAGNPQSLINVDEVARFDKKLKAAMPFVAADKVAFILPYKPDYFKYKSKLTAVGVKVVKAWEFLAQPDQPTTYNAATSYGFLRRLADADFESGNYTDRDILIFPVVPLDVGPVAGIISELPQVAHSHVIFRAVNQKVPDMFIPGLTELPVVQSNLDKLVKFTSKDDGTFEILPATGNAQMEQEAEQYWASRVPNIPPPVSDLSVKALYNWQGGNPTPDNVKSYGSKGSNFAILDTALRASGVDRSLYNGAFLAPFDVFDQHMNSVIKKKDCDKAQAKCETETGASCAEVAGLCQQNAQKTLRDFRTAFLADGRPAKMIKEAPLRRQYLAFMRRLIQKVDLPAGAVQQIHDKLKAAFKPDRRIRFRSSTNAEDLAGLTGAGLYESKSACLADDGVSDDAQTTPSPCRTPYELTRIKDQAAKLKALPDTDGRLAPIIKDLESGLTDHWPLDKTIGKVFASLWTERAFLTREYYKMDHTKVYMGMLVMPAFIDEQVNGVAVIRFDDDGSMEMNTVVQVQDISITNPIFPDAVPEQVIVRLGADGTLGAAKYITHSNQTTGASNVLSDAELKEMVTELQVVGKAMMTQYGPAIGKRFDIEVMLDHDRKLLVKQARPL